MTTRMLKGITGALIAAGVLIIASWPFVIGTPPKNRPRAEIKAYFVRSLAATSVLIVVVSGAGIGAFLLMRRVREEYREQSMANMKALLEQTREDQLRKAERESAEE